MVSIEITRNQVNEIVGFTANGHANYHKAGEDIVCAGVSALTQTAVLGVARYLPDDVYCQAGAGKLVLKLQSKPTVETNAILETMVLGLQEIIKLNPKHVRIVEIGGEHDG